MERQNSSRQFDDRGGHEGATDLKDAACLSERAAGILPDKDIDGLDINFGNPEVNSQTILPQALRRFAGSYLQSIGKVFAISY